MSEPTRQDFEQLAAGIDVDAAFAVFERRRRRRQRTRRGVFAVATAVVVLAAAGALLTINEDSDQPVATKPGGEALDIGACELSLSGEPFSFADLLEVDLAWVDAEGIQGEPFPEYDEYVRDFYGRIGADQDLLDAASFQRVEFANPVVRRPGTVDDVTYDDSDRTVVAPTTMVESVSTEDTLVAAISQSSDGASGDPADVDFVETLAVIHPDGTVEFAGNCARDRYTEPFGRAASTLIADAANEVETEADVLHRMIEDTVFARVALAAAGERSQLDGIGVALPALEPGYSHSMTTSDDSILEISVLGGELCVTLSDETGGGSACHPDTEARPIVAFASTPDTGESYAFGAVNGAVASVVGITNDGETFDGDAQLAPDGAVTLFAIPIPDGTPLVEIQCLDQNGELIGTLNGLGLVGR